MGKNLLNLKRKEIRKIVSYTNEEGKLEEIKIFNPNPTVQDEIKNVILSYSEKTKGNLSVNIPPVIVVSEIITKVTDLEIPKGTKEEDIVEVMNDPSIPLQKVMGEVLLLILELGEIGITFLTFMDNVDKLTGISDADLNKLIKESEKKNIKPKEKAKPRKAKKTTKKEEEKVIDLEDKKEVKKDEEVQ